MSHYTMLYKYGKQTREFWGFFILFILLYPYPIFLYFGGFFNKTITPFVLVGYEIGYSQLPLME